MNDPKSISTITKKTQKNTQKPKPNQEHSIRSKKIHKTSQNFDKPFKFTENSHKIIKEI